MMTRMSAVGPEALTRRERISSGLTSVMREGKLASGATSRRDRLLGISPVGSPSPLSVDLSEGNELREEDVWGMPVPEDNPLEDLVDGADPSRLLKNGRQWLGLDKDPFSDRSSPLGLSAINRPAANSRDATPVRKATTSRMIPQVASSYGSGRQMLHQSAPVNIPDWSKILGMDKRNKENGFSIADDDVDDVEEEKLPPHELVARDYARSHTAFSVYEGAGRTLKGRDLSRVRNAVWKQTGFIGG